MLPCLSVIMCLHVLMSRGPWEQGHIKSGIKHVLCKARQSPPFMITAEAKKNRAKQYKTTKYEFKHLGDGTDWFWSGTPHFLWVESNGKL